MQNVILFRHSSLSRYEYFSKLEENRSCWINTISFVLLFGCQSVSITGRQQLSSITAPAHVPMLAADKVFALCFRTRRRARTSMTTTMTPCLVTTVTTSMARAAQERSRPQPSTTTVASVSPITPVLVVSHPDYIIITFNVTNVIRQYYLGLQIIINLWYIHD